MPPAERARRDVFVIDADCHPQTIAVVRTRAEPLGSRWSSATRTTDLPLDGVFGVLLQYPGSSGEIRDLARSSTGCTAGRDGRGGRRPALARSCCAAGQWAPTSSSAPRSGSACPLGSAARTPRSSRPATRTAHDAGPPRRRVGRRRRTAGAASRTADARAAHPAREGDEQHLHRAGAARRDGRPLRRVPRPDGCAIAGRVHRLAASWLAARPREAASTSRPGTSSTRTPYACRADGRTSPPRRRGIGLRVDDADTLGISLDDTTDAASVAAPACRAFGRHRVDARRAAARRGDPGAPAPQTADPRAPGVPPLPLRDRDAALPAPPRRPGPRARPHDDPARVVHDEAQRHYRDDPGHLAQFAAVHPLRPWNDDVVAAGSSGRRSARRSSLHWRRRCRSWSSARSPW